MKPVDYTNPETLSADDLAAVEALGRKAFDAIVAAAEKDAKLFAQEYPGASIEGDWDSTAWEVTGSELRRFSDLEPRMAEADETAGHAVCWAIYAQALHAAVDRGL